MSTHQMGPVTGVGDGTLFIGWPCRVGDTGPFSLVPVAAKWDLGLPGNQVTTIWIAAMDPRGTVEVLDIETLNFDPKWVRQ